MNNLLHLVKIEWLKLSKYRAFKVLLGLFLISLFGVNYVTYEVLSASMRIDGASMLIGTPFQFPEVWHTVSYLSSFLLFIPGLIMILIMSNEYTYRTHRQNIIDGISRNQFINAKIALIFIISICLAIVVFFVAAMFGLFCGGSLSFVKIEYIFYYLIQSISYISIAFLLIILFRRSGISIGVYFLYAFVLEEILVALLNRLLSPIGYFLPLESADKLIPIHLSFVSGMNQNIPDGVYFLITSCVWITLSLWYCKYKFGKDDL